jgi:hypothetical protein
MNINLKDENFIKSVEEYTGRPLNQRDDVRGIIKIVMENKKEKEFSELVFTSKYICGLMRVINNASAISEVKSVDQIKFDLSENIKKGVERLKGIISFAEDGQRDYFEKTYLSLTAQNFSNLSQLFSDLEAVKKYLNYQKRLSE